MLLLGSLGYAAPRDAPIIGGSGAFKYQYMPELLQPPPGSSLLTGSDAHGLVTDAKKNIYLTYVGDEGKDANCLIRWKPDGTGGEFVSTGNVSKLCSGTPHGLTIAAEGNQEFLCAPAQSRSHELCLPQPMRDWCASPGAHTTENRARRSREQRRVADEDDARRRDCLAA